MGTLPRIFDFYGLGEVRLYPASEAGDEELFWVGMQIDGDENDPWLFCGFSASLDRSMYTEMANVIASRWAGSAGRMISPPIPLPQSWVSNLNRVEHESFVYKHMRGEEAIPIQVRIVPRLTQGPLTS